MKVGQHTGEESYWHETREGRPGRGDLGKDKQGEESAAKLPCAAQHSEVGTGVKKEDIIADILQIISGGVLEGSHENLRKKELEIEVLVIKRKHKLGAVVHVCSPYSQEGEQELTGGGRAIQCAQGQTEMHEETFTKTTGEEGVVVFASNPVGRQKQEFREFKVILSY